MSFTLFFANTLLYYYFQELPAHQVFRSLPDQVSWIMLASSFFIIWYLRPERLGNVSAGREWGPAKCRPACLHAANANCTGFQTWRSLGTSGSVSRNWRVPDFSCANKTNSNFAKKMHRVKIDLDCNYYCYELLPIISVTKIVTF